MRRLNSRQMHRSFASLRMTRSSTRQIVQTDSNDPAATHHDVSVIEDGGLPRSDGALWPIKRDENLIFTSALNHGCRRLVAMANLYGDSHWLSKFLDRDQIHTSCAQGARVQMLIAANDHLLVSTADLDDAERRSGGDAESLALANGEIVNAGVLADHCSICC